MFIYFYTTGAPMVTWNRVLAPILGAPVATAVIQLLGNVPPDVPTAVMIPVALFVPSTLTPEGLKDIL